MTRPIFVLVCYSSLQFLCEEIWKQPYFVAKAKIKYVVIKIIQRSSDLEQNLTIKYF